MCIYTLMCIYVHIYIYFSWKPLQFYVDSVQMVIIEMYSFNVNDVVTASRAVSFKI